MDFSLSPMNYLMMGMWAAAVLAGPPLLIATGVGLMIALVQTLIQLQEQTLPVAVKLITVSAVLLMVGYKLVSPLYVLTQQIFIEFPAIAR